MLKSRFSRRRSPLKADWVVSDACAIVFQLCLAGPDFLSMRGVFVSYSQGQKDCGPWGRESKFSVLRTCTLTHESKLLEDGSVSLESVQVVTDISIHENRVTCSRY